MADTIPELVQKYSHQYKLDPEVVAAVILQESSGCPFAFRYEKWWHDRRVPTDRSKLVGHVPAQIPTLDTERMARATSWGLMQILGDTARSMLGYKNDYLASLLNPDLNIELGCRLLRQLLNRHGGLGPKEQYTAALKDYNGSAAYPKLIFAHIEQGRHLKFLPA